MMLKIFIDLLNIDWLKTVFCHNALHRLSLRNNLNPSEDEEIEALCVDSYLSICTVSMQQVYQRLEHTVYQRLILAVQPVCVIRFAGTASNRRLKLPAHGPTKQKKDHAGPW